MKLQGRVNSMHAGSFPTPYHRKLGIAGGTPHSANLVLAGVITYFWWECSISVFSLCVASRVVSHVLYFGLKLVEASHMLLDVF